LIAAGEEQQFARWRVLSGSKPTAPPVLEKLELLGPKRPANIALASNCVAFTTSSGSQIAKLGDLPLTETSWRRTIQGINGISPDQRWLGIFGSFTPWLYIYRLPQIEPVAMLTSKDLIRSFSFDPLTGALAVSSRAGVQFWSTNTWTLTRVLTNFGNILFSPDGSTWWLTRDLRTAGLYDAKTLEVLLPLPTGTLPLRVSPDGQHLAVSVDSRRLQLWDLHQLRTQLRELGVDWASSANRTEPTTPEVR
jgi:WD40 repeat protein